MSTGEQERRVAHRLRIAAAAVLLLAYILPVVVLPTLHGLVELVESTSCAACTDRAPRDASPSWEAVCCCAGAPCSEPGHRHHNHPVHDARHCTLCSSVSATQALIGDAATGLAPIDTTFVSFLVQGEDAPASRAPLVEVARGPPLFAAIS